MTNDPGQAMRMVRRAHEIDDECGTYADVLANLYARYGRLTDSLYFAKLSPTLEPHPILGGLLISGLDNYFKALSESEKPNFTLKTAAADFKNGDFQSAREAREKELRLEKREQSFIISLVAFMWKWAYARKLFPCSGRWRTWMELRFVSVFCSPTPWRKTVNSSRRGEACFRVAAKMGGKSHRSHGCSNALDWIRALISVRSSTGTLTNRPLKTPPSIQRPTTAGDPCASASYRINFDRAALFDIVAPWIIHADKKMVEIYCYNASEISDERTAALKRRATKWSDIAEIDDQTLLYILDADGIDVMIDYTLDWTVARDNVLERGIAPVRLGLAERGGPQTSSPANPCLDGNRLDCPRRFRVLG